MKVVFPVAGLGTRLRPHTYTQPKPLVQVAGKAVLAHVLDQLTSLPIEEIIFITGHLGTKIEKYVHDNYKIPARFVLQAELRGQDLQKNERITYSEYTFHVIYTPTNGYTAAPTGDLAQNHQGGGQ